MLTVNVDSATLPTQLPASAYQGKFWQRNYLQGISQWLA